MRIITPPLLFSRGAAAAVAGRARRRAAGAGGWADMSGGLRFVHFLRLLQPAHQSSLAAGPLLLQVHPLAADVELVAGTAAVVVTVVAVVVVVTVAVAGVGLVAAPVVTTKFGASCLAATL